MSSTSDGGSPARRLRDALEPIAALNFHSAPALDGYARLGLDEFPAAYFWLRSSVLGVVAPAVVVATFGVWEPGFVRANLEAGRRAASWEQIRTATDSGAASAARVALDNADPAEMAQVSAVLRRGIDAADATARPLFAGNRELARLDDPFADLWRVATAWRELRGDTHLAACVAHRITGLQANILNELDAGYELGEYTATRNWSEQETEKAAAALRDRGLIGADSLTEAGVTLRQRLEDATDAGVADAVDAVGTDLDGVVDRTDSWARSIIDRGWFPDDDRKRAAG